MTYMAGIGTRYAVHYFITLYRKTSDTVISDLFAGIHRGQGIAVELRLALADV